jgi:hypothetical protein
MADADRGPEPGGGRRSLGHEADPLNRERPRLEILATDIEDHPENETRFGVVARDTIPAPTGHDKTSIVVFQKADEPGSLLSILQEFAARAINLTNLHSRPTKRGLGDYCFLIELEGHLSDELVADCLRDLKSKQSDVKFLGSYPAASPHGESVRRDADAAHRTRCAERHARLKLQRRDLARCYDELLARAADGKAFWRVYRQFKMYNDPALNPYLRHPPA